MLVGHDAAGGVHALATGCGEALPVDSGIVMAFEVGGAPYLLVSGPEDKLVYPILPMP